MTNRTLSIISKITFLLLLLTATSVAFAQKKGKKNKKSIYQNITTKFNILFNANEIIRLSVGNLSQNYPYQFDQLLPVYLSPEETLVESLRGNMDLVNQKCDKIIEFKSRSKFVDRAYLLKGIASYYKGSYFLSAEYFDYVSQEYDSVKVTVAQAKYWKARSYTKIKNFKLAHSALDSAFAAMDLLKKYDRGQIYATASQLAIAQEDYPRAIAQLLKALENSTNSDDRIRWNYVLAQLYDRSNQMNNAAVYYLKVAKSNANFNLSFNASLNKIRIDAFNNPTEDLRTKALLALTRDEKNTEYLDQIYYQIGSVYLNDQKYDQAIEEYKKSVAASIGNDAQKGLSYLAIGDVSFQYKNDYLTAKNYYDTAVNILPKSFKNYNLIVRKANNLQDLADYYSTISNQDTLQFLVKLPESERNDRIQSIAKRVFREKFLKDSIATLIDDIKNNPNNPKYNPYLVVNAPLSSNNNFYFNNRNAVQQGYSDFKRVWGSRNLSDNWRISDGNNGNFVQNTDEEEKKKAEELQLVQAKKDVLSGKEAKGIEEYVKNMQQNLPLSPQKLLISDKLIIESYYKMGNFYRDILEDKASAIQAYETLMRRFPNNYRSSESYYNLYRLLSGTDMAKANYYKDLLVRNFPQTAYAKILTDPNYARNYKGELGEMNAAYDLVFNDFVKRKYANVLTEVAAANKDLPNNELAPQFDYLKAIALGHLQHVDVLLKDLEALVSNYPKDGLISPLVTEHINFLKANYDYYKIRPIALNDEDDLILLGWALNDPLNKGYLMEDYDSFQRKEVAIKKAMKKEPEIAKAMKEKAKLIIEEKKKANELAKVGLGQLDANPLNAKFDGPNTMALPKVDSSKLRADAAVLDGSNQKLNLGNMDLNSGLGMNAKINAQNGDLLARLKSEFTEAKSNAYYYVINVFDESAILSSSRFGIGQFIRANYANANINHNLKELNRNQLIFVGPFASLESVKDFQNKIKLNIPSIMKINPADYETFIITKENLSQIKDTNTTYDYVLFYNLTIK